MEQPLAVTRFDSKLPCLASEVDESRLDKDVGLPVATKASGQLTVALNGHSASRGNTFRFSASVGTWLQPLPIEQPLAVTWSDSMLPCLASEVDEHSAPRGDTFRFSASVGTWLQPLPMAVTRFDSMLPSLACLHSCRHRDEEPLDQCVPAIVSPQTDS